MLLLLLVAVAAGWVGAFVRPVRPSVVLAAIAGAGITAFGGYLLESSPTVVAMQGTSTLNGHLSVDYGPVRCDGALPVSVPSERATSTNPIMVERALACGPARELRQERGWALVAVGQAMTWVPQIMRRRRRADNLPTRMYAGGSGPTDL